MIALSVILMPAGHTSVQHLVMLQYPIPKSSLISVCDFSVEWVHFQPCEPDKEPRTSELVEFLMFTKNVTGIHTEHAFNALLNS